MKDFFKYFVSGTLMVIFLSFMPNVNAEDFRNHYISTPPDSIIPSIDTPVTLPYPINTNGEYPLNGQPPKSALYLDQPSNVTTDVQYDAENDEYIIQEKIGNINYGPPIVVSSEDYRKYDFDRAINDYWKQKFRTESFTSQGGLIPKINLGGDLGDAIGPIDIKPQGSAELIFGLQINKIENPQLPIRLQRTTTFDFQEKIQMNVTGNIGDRLKLSTNYNTEATFDFENKMNLQYEGKEDEIIQKIEAGDVNLPLSGSLITGSQSLFGIKTEMKFGKLTATTVFSQQKGKSQVIEVEGGAQTNDFEVYADSYEANKHFFLAQYFRDRYDEANSQLPTIISSVNISRVEVWVTNKTGNYEESRNIIGFMDLAEEYNVETGLSNIYAQDYVYPEPIIDYIPYNEQNNLYTEMTTTYSGIRSINDISSTLAGLAMDPTNFVAGRDYEKIENARRLKETEYTLNRELGYISLNSSLNADEVLAVAFEYTTRDGKVYQVGEFSNGGIQAPQTLIVKLLRGTSFTPRYPTWKLMMKNVYALGAYQINPLDFQLHVMYQNDKTGSEINYLPEGAIANTILLKILNLDRTNSQGDASPDGQFDFLPGKTINPTNGRIYFPVLEPFGSHLRKKITDNNPANEELNAIADYYVFQELYDSTQSTAQQRADKNKFLIKGKYQSSSSSEIALNAYNIPQGSVQITAGAAQLVENIDYTVDYNLGRVKILNQGLLESGTPIKISLESNTMFNIQSKTLMGTNLDYRFSNDFNIGATILNLTERPLTQKTSIGDEPISNTIWGVNANYRTEAPYLTKMIDKLPFLETKAQSIITTNVEFAQLLPGHPKLKGIDKSGVSYIDDFEGSKTSIDIRSFAAWTISSTPSGNFPEGILNDSVWYGYNRARLGWYVIDPILNRKSANRPDHLSDDELSNHLTREVYENEIFPFKESQNGIPTNIAVLNLAFYPSEKGPYNYDVNPTSVSAGVNADGKLNNPISRWGGIMRDLQTNDFEAANIEFIEFWMMDPFVYNKDHNGGQLYFNLGNVSEDILKDSRKSFENGLPITEEATLVDSTAWGRVPIQQALVNAFDNDANSRTYQDVGLDGLRTDDERSFFNHYVNAVKAAHGETSAAYNQALQDPSSDDFMFFRGTEQDNDQLGILDRYKKYNGLEGNSPTSEQSTESYPTSATTIPNVEDINRDNTLSETESYFQYRIDLKPETMEIGENFIYDKIDAPVTLENSTKDTVTWYQFKIPIQAWEKAVGSISDFKSIRFVRMFLTGFDEEIFLRFATMDLVRGDWRKYQFSMREPGFYPAPSNGNNTEFDISAVNIEENGKRQPINYVLPPGVSRVIDPTNPQLRQLNEQSIVLKVCNLEDGDAKAAYKNVNMDVRQYKRLELEIHAEENGEPLNDGDLRAFLRLGTDYQQNYYEYEVPLVITPPGSYNNDNETDREIVWPSSNRIDFDFELLQEVKQKRNDLLRNGDILITDIYEFNSGKSRIRIRGNPNLSNIKTIMIGLRNPNEQTNPDPDDGLPKCGEVWMNELRLSDFNEKGGWAAIGRVNARLADCGTINVAGQTSKPGFGSIEKKVQERSQEDVYQYDIASNLELGKFFPEKTGVRIPMHVGYSEGIINPQFNPLDPDIPLKVAMNDPNITQEQKDSIKFFAQNYTKRKSLNFTNVKINKSTTKPKIYDINNWAANYSFSEMYTRNVNTEKNLTKNYRGGIAYNYNTTPKNYTPFKSVKNKNLKLIKDFNYYLLPQQLSFRTDLDRRYNELKLRNISTPDMLIEPSYNKDFTWSRLYDLKYNLTKNMKMDFTATNLARIDEPDGVVDKDLYKTEYDLWKDSVMTNLKNLGRTTQYSHQLDLTYTIPINKIKQLDWVSASTRYSATYNWTAGPALPDSTDYDPGNTIRNSRNMQANLQLNMLNLYNKVPYLKKVNQKYRSRGNQRKPEKKFENVQYPGKDEDKVHVRLSANVPKFINHKLKTEDVEIKVLDTLGKEIKGRMRVINENRLEFIPETDCPVAQILVTGKRELKESLLVKIVDNTFRVMMGVKNVSLSYTGNDGTILPGYKPSTKYLGQQNLAGNLAPGLPFAFGNQDRDFGIDAGNLHDWLSRDTTLMNPYLMTHTENWNFRATIEPINNLRIDVTANTSKSNNLSENIYYFPGSGEYRRENAMYTGNFSTTIITWGTAFEKVKSDEGYFSQTFQNFKDYRYTIASKLASERYQNRGDNLYDPFGNVDSLGFPDGYSRSSQDVLIPAFLAAYSNKNPDKIGLTSMPKIPLPNWRINYDGLAKIKFFKKYLRTFTISHAYRSSYTIGSFTTNLRYEEDNDGLSWIRENLETASSNSNFIAKEEINAVSINEQFSPLLLLDMTWNNSLISKIEFKKRRNLSLSFSNNQLMDMSENEVVIGSGFIFRNVPLKLNGKEVTSDLNLRADLSFRKNLTVIRKLEEEVDQPTAGQKVITLKLSGDYVLNNRFNLRVFFDKDINRPQIATTFPTSNTNFGISIRFTLAS
ncbi:MAG: cell surface protein SprA [Bacteroidales bacterium]|nr:cell surface protein SprA [Bacteroidales bacterium]